MCRGDFSDGATRKEEKMDDLSIFSKKNLKHNIIAVFIVICFSLYFLHFIFALSTCPDTASPVTDKVS